MSRLLVVNPNTSQAMTSTIRVSAESAAQALGVDVDTLCPSCGPESIEGRFDEIVSAYWTLETIMRVADRYDGIVVACFSQHVAIEGIREALEIPTMGIFEASVLYALPLGARFSIVTTSPRWEPLLTDGVRSLGVHERCASVRSSGLAVLDLDRLPHQEVLQHLAEQAELAVAQDGAEVILLGCAGMAGLQAAVAERVRVPVIDAVAAGVSLVGALALAHARMSKRNLYRPVLTRNITDLPPGLARIYGSSA
ncbi:MAG: aspartate/glutamate racemase family protein [Chloroflexi bacterium]|nr:aspartate/glutamate racemase family protein [Chloroflexota bacterium]